MGCIIAVEFNRNGRKNAVILKIPFQRHSQCQNIQKNQLRIGNQYLRLTNNPLSLAGTISRNFHSNKMQSFLGIQSDWGYTSSVEGRSLCLPTNRSKRSGMKNFRHLNVYLKGKLFAQLFSYCLKQINSCFLAVALAGWLNFNLTFIFRLNT